MNLTSRPIFFVLLLASAAATSQQPVTQPRARQRRIRLPRQKRPIATQATLTPRNGACDAGGASAEGLSRQSRYFLSHALPDEGPPDSLAERRKGTDAYTARARIEWTEVCPTR